MSIQHIYLFVDFCKAMTTDTLLFTRLYIYCEKQSVSIALHGCGFVQAFKIYTLYQDYIIGERHFKQSNLVGVYFIQQKDFRIASVLDRLIFYAVYQSKIFQLSFIVYAGKFVRHHVCL